MDTGLDSGAVHLAEAELKARKRELRELKRQIEGRPLDSWERYRALRDVLGQSYDLIEISNREARLALMLMGGLNAGVVVIATRTHLIASLNGIQRILFGGLLAVYGVTAVYFMLQAIEALRPRRFRPTLDEWDRAGNDYPMGVRYYEDIVTRDVRRHWLAWHEVSLGQLNAEIAIELHSVSRTNNVKRIGLQRLFAGLRVMTLLVAAIVSIIVYSAWK